MTFERKEKAIDFNELLANEESQKNLEMLEPWEEGFKDGSIQKSVELDIYPPLNPRMGAVYNVIIKSLPKEFETKEYGRAFSMNVEYNESMRNIVCTRTILHQLAVQRRKLGLKAIELIDKHAVVFADIINMKGQRTRVINIQIKK